MRSMLNWTVYAPSKSFQILEEHTNIIWIKQNTASWKCLDCDLWLTVPLCWGKKKRQSVSHSVGSHSLGPHGLQPTRLPSGILQARILERVAISFSRGSSRPRDRTQVSHIAGRRFNLCTTRETRLASLKCWILSIVNFYFYFFSIREGGNTEMSVRL